MATARVYIYTPPTERNSCGHRMLITLHHSLELSALGQRFPCFEGNKGFYDSVSECFS